MSQPCLPRTVSKLSYIRCSLNTLIPKSVNLCYFQRKSQNHKYSRPQLHLLSFHQYLHLQVTKYNKTALVNFPLTLFTLTLSSQTILDTFHRLLQLTCTLFVTPLFHSLSLREGESAYLNHPPSLSLLPAAKLFRRPLSYSRYTIWTPSCSY